MFLPKFEVKLNILLKFLKVGDSMPNFRDFYIPRSSAFKKFVDDSAFSIRENVCPHKPSPFTIVGKGLNTFLLYNRERRVGASERDAKNSAKRREKQWSNPP